MKKIFLTMSCLLATFVLFSCNNDIEETFSNTKYSFEELTFDVNVNGKSGYGGDTRAYSNKTSWTDGDVIYFSIDGNDANTCKMTYGANGQWTVEELSESANFAKENGTLSAVYAEKSSYSTSGIETSGDILYTTSGSYAKSGNAVRISLNMSNRPLSRITINGIGSGFTLSGKSFSGVKSISNASWTKANGITAYDVTGQKATYFGLIEPNADNTTTVTLRDEETATEYYRTYNKRMNAGEAIVINGPLSSESAEWTKTVCVTSLTLDKTHLSMLVGEEAYITATILPQNATNKSLSWMGIIFPDQSVMPIMYIPTNNVCYVKALTKGNIIITVQTENGLKTANCGIQVGEMSDYVISYANCSSITSINGYKFLPFFLTISNSLPSEIVIKNVKMTDETTGETLKIFTFDKDIATLDTDKSRTYSIPINGTYASYFGFTTTFTYNGSSYTTECTYNIDK